jgi:hypothetical protein
LAIVSSTSFLRHLGIAEIAGEQQRLAALLLDRVGGDPRVVVLLEIGDGDLRALAREQHRGRAPDPAVSAGDDRDLVLQPAGTRIARLPIGLGIELRLVAGELRLLGDRLDFGFLDGLGVIGHGEVLSPDQ